MTGRNPRDGDDGIERQTSRTQPISEPADAVLARSTATDLATTVGFPEDAVEELGLVAAELAENVVKHADVGELTVTHVLDGDRNGVRIRCVDAGPGIAHVEHAFADGESTAGSVGGGLGALNRLMDRVTVGVSGEPEYGTRIVADRWVKPAYEQTRECPLDFGAASRPKVPNTPNGDSFVLKRWNDEALVGVIDGLGHGLKAHRATTAAQQYVESHFDQPFDALFEGTDRACRGTRGVVMALARFDWVAETATIAGLGNISIHMAGPASTSIPMRRGVLGSTGPSPLVEEIDWQPEYRLALHSDGLRSRWTWEECEDLTDEGATAQARELLDRYGKNDDDSTILVVSGADGGT